MNIEDKTMISMQNVDNVQFNYKNGELTYVVYNIKTDDGIRPQVLRLCADAPPVAAVIACENKHEDVLVHYNVEDLKAAVSVKIKVSTLDLTVEEVADLKPLDLAEIYEKVDLSHIYAGKLKANNFLHVHRVSHQLGVQRTIDDDDNLELGDIIIDTMEGKFVICAPDWYIDIPSVKLNNTPYDCDSVFSMAFS